MPDHSYKFLDFFEQQKKKFSSKSVILKPKHPPVVFRRRQKQTPQVKKHTALLAKPTIVNKKQAALLSPKTHGPTTKPTSSTKQKLDTKAKVSKKSVTPKETIKEINLNEVKSQEKKETKGTSLKKNTVKLFKKAKIAKKEQVKLQQKTIEKTDKLKDKLINFEIGSPMLDGYVHPKKKADQTNITKKPLTFADLLKGFSTKPESSNQNSKSYNPLTNNTPIQSTLRPGDEVTRYIYMLIIKLNQALEKLRKGATHELLWNLSQLKERDFMIFFSMNRQGVITGIYVDPPFQIRELNNVVLKTTEKNKPMFLLNKNIPREYYNFSVPLTFSVKLNSPKK